MPIPFHRAATPRKGRRVDEAFLRRFLNAALAESGSEVARWLADPESDHKQRVLDAMREPGVALLLLRLLARRSVARSTFRGREELYRVLLEYFPRLALECDSLDAAALQTVADVLQTALTLVHDAPADPRLPDWLPPLQARAAALGADASEARDAFARMLELVAPAPPPPPPPPRAVARRRTTARFDPRTQGAPGGRDHDNDAVCFRDVAIVPTAAELLCGDAPYLPQWPGDPRLQRTPVDRYLDLHFRWLREDLVVELRQLMEATVPRRGPPRFIDAETSQRVSVLRGVRCLGLHGSPFQGVGVLLEFAEPTGKAKGKKAKGKEKKKFWADGAGKRLFGRDSVVVCDRRLVGIVMRRDEMDAHRRLVVRPARPEDLADWLRVAGAQLLQAQNSFFPAYGPVLEALHAHTAATLPFAAQLAGDGGAAPQLPQYVRGHFDLSPLGGPRVAPVRDLAAGLARTTSLDATQQQACQLALTSDVALIQGPPGTGKTYVGVAIVRVLLASTINVRDERVRDGQMEALPILVVCYTNHALDDFLTECVDAGVPLEDLVRVGGRCNNERLQSRVLYDLVGSEKKSGFGRCWRHLKNLEAKMDAAVQQPRSTLDWMRDDDVYAEWCDAWAEGLVDDEGFEVADAKGVNAWLAGRGFPAAAERLCERRPDRAWFVRPEERRPFWERLCAECAEDSERDLEDLAKRYDEAVEQAQEIEDAAALRVLRSSRVVAMTTSGAAKYQRLLQTLGARVVVVEEAGEVLEAHVLACLTPETQHLVMIGDHQQLRPSVSDYHLGVDSGGPFSLDRSLFERLAAAAPIVTLHRQWRMRPAIADVLRGTLYPALEDAPRVRAYPDVRGLDGHLHWLAHDGRATNDDGSWRLDREAQLAAELAVYFVRQGYGKDRVVVLTPYAGQLLALRAQLRDRHVLSYLSDRDRSLLDLEQEEGGGGRSRRVDTCVRLATVDNFQGEEADVVIVSVVRSQGFLKSDNRVNVMLSRARHGMIVIGNAARIPAGTMLQTASELIPRVNALPLRCATHGNITHVASAEDVRAGCPDGGCAELCLTRRADCGHACQRHCHPDDPAHEAQGPCRQQCTSTLDCGHPCAALCGRPHKCTAKVQVPLPCGHSATLACGRELPANWQCRVRVARVVPGCGHTVQRRCCDALGLCDEPCGAALDECGHACSGTCGGCAAAGGQHHECPEPCAELCEHSVCPGTCSSPCAPCMEPCPWTCPHRPGDCALPCGVPCARERCDEVCGKPLACGHACALLCGENCVCLQCRGLQGAGDVLLDCGHAFFAAQQLDASPSSCPACGLPVAGVRRYGAVIKRRELDRMSRRFFAWAARRLAMGGDPMAVVLSLDEQSPAHRAQACRGRDSTRVQTLLGYLLAEGRMDEVQRVHAAFCAAEDGHKRFAEMLPAAADFTALRPWLGDGICCRNLARRCDVAAEALAKQCDEALRRREGWADPRDPACVVALVANGLHDKDLFLESYRDLLARRLLCRQRSAASASFEAEREFVGLLKKEGLQTSKLEGMLVGSSSDLSLVVGPLEPRVLKSGVWPAFRALDPVLPAPMARWVEEFTAQYGQRHPERRLQWVHAAGRAVVRARFVRCAIDLDVSSLQAMTLLLFNDDGGFTIEALKQRLGVDAALAEQLLLSLRGPLQRDSDSGAFAVKAAFFDKRRRLRMPEQRMPVPSARPRVEHNRTFEIDACIVRVMKSRGELTVSELMHTVLQQLSASFKPKIKDIKRRMESLIEREFVERVEGEKKRLRYVA